MEETNEFKMVEQLSFKAHKSKNQIKITIPKKLIEFFELQDINYIFIHVKNKNKKNIVIFEKLYKNNGSYVVNITKYNQKLLGINLNNYREFDFYLKY